MIFGRDTGEQRGIKPDAGRVSFDDIRDALTG